MKAMDRRQLEITAELMRLFRSQHGVLTRAQVLQAGATRHLITARLREGAWAPLHPGVYRLAGSPVSPEQRIAAAVLASGPGAAASHRSAAYLWGLLDHGSEQPTVTIPYGRRVQLS